ncbi:glycosyltransferase family 4 protein [Ramlibacter sp.]|uniref:glycosyltransferase family 4 protein n=1 Tax=Ramlibacter sp. TaxID=1917967 RepID=UPI002C1E4C06|nr:glycosyltransferase family 4 protein [Ramlibacter sp.]HWI80380.1 glycosyltransferase family 4 protein [Ramlibacter sp.]
MTTTSGPSVVGPSAPGLRKVAIAHARLGWGGSEVYVMWGIDALVKAGYEVTLLTLGDVELTELNAWCGTSLRNGDFHVRRPGYVPALTPLLRAAAVRDSLFQRFCRSVAGEFDVLISGYNPCDFGQPAVHLVQDFSWHQGLRDEFDAPPADGSWRIHRKGPLRAAYLGLAGLLAAPSGRNLLAGRDLFVANSRWVADLARERCGFCNQRVVYPPVVFRSEPLPDAGRDDGFVILGRVGAEKRIEQAIEIIGRLRGMGHAVRLHIVGDLAAGTPYGDKIGTLVGARSTWVIAEGRQVGVEKEWTLMRHRYAIHARPGEAFGIGVAELVKAGCIPFVPALGGPAEIVGAPELCWSGIDDAVRAIDRVLQDPVRQTRLRRHLAERAALFGIDRFQREFLRAIEHFAAQSTPLELG